MHSPHLCRFPAPSRLLLVGACPPLNYHQGSLALHLAINFLVTALLQQLLPPFAPSPSPYSPKAWLSLCLDSFPAHHKLRRWDRVCRDSPLLRPKPGWHPLPLQEEGALRPCVTLLDAAVLLV